MIKFSVDRNELFEAVSVPARNFMFVSHAMDLFKCLHITVDSQSGLSFMAIDGYSEIEIRDIPITVLGSDADEFSEIFLIDCMMLQRILTATSKAVVVFELTDSEIKVVTESSYKIPTQDASGYPVIEKSLEGYNEKIEVMDTKFLRVLDTVTPFVTNELSKPHLAGIAITDYVYMSTDGHCGVVHARVENAFGQMTLFPYFIKVLNSMKGVTSFDFYRGPNAFVIIGDDYFYKCRLPQTEFPYSHAHQLLEKRASGLIKVSVNSASFLSALSRITIVAGDKFSRLRVLLQEEGLTLGYLSEKSRISAGETLEYTSKDKFEESGTSLLFSLSSIESCKKIFSDSDKNLTFTYIDSASPVFIKQEGVKYLFFILPQREM